MTDREKRINIILINVAKGKYDLAHLKEVLARGLQHVECMDARFIHNLACIDEAIKRIERHQTKKEN